MHSENNRLSLETVLFYKSIGVCGNLNEPHFDLMFAQMNFLTEDRRLEDFRLPPMVILQRENQMYLIS